MSDGGPRVDRVSRARWRRLYAVLAAAVLLGVAAEVPAVREPILRGVGRALVVDEPVESADIIVLPRWAGAAGAVDAADLVRSGLAGRVALIREFPTSAERELIRRGIPYVDETTQLVQLLRSLGVSDIDMVPELAGGTESEGQVLRSWCVRHQFRSIVVISAPDHSRRVRRVLHRALVGQPTRVVIRSARYSSFDPDRWWKRRDTMRTGIVELQKLLLDIARHPVS